jgi:hypothetical protein
MFSPIFVSHIICGWRIKFPQLMAKISAGKRQQAKTLGGGLFTVV